MNAPFSVDRKTFLLNLRQSKLLTEAEFAHARQQTPTEPRGRALARVLIQQQLLTPFQAEHLLAGRNSGFLLGQYRILDQLGRGGMGRVFKAEHRTMKRVVALKVLAPNLLQSESARALFLREVQAIAQLVHPNIVTAYDASEDDSRYYLVLEYVDGPNLDQLVRKQGPLSVGLACDYVKQTANGLQAAHALGMVHRDVKPANLLVQRRGLHDQAPGLVKLSDFGLARLHAPELAPAAPRHAGTILAAQNTVMGTPDFLSPEQARDLHAVDIRSDLYSLGCTFYYLLTGRVPHPGGSAVDKLLRHHAETPTLLSELRPDVPKPVAAIVSRLMAKSAAERYQTPLELAAVLEPFAVSGPTPWDNSPTSVADVDLVNTPSSDADASSCLLEGNSADDWSALVGTATPGVSPTILNPLFRSRPELAHRLRPLLRRRRTLWLGLGVVFLAIATLVAVLIAVLR